MKGLLARLTVLLGEGLMEEITHGFGVFSVELCIPFFPRVTGKKYDAGGFAHLLVVIMYYG